MKFNNYNFINLFCTITLIFMLSGTASSAHYTNTNDRKDFTMKTITVDKSGKGNFTTVQQAIDSVPDENMSWVRIHIKAATYTEKVSIKREKQFIFLEGESSRNTIIAWGDAGDVVKSPTFSSHADNIAASKITFKNFYNHDVKSPDDNDDDGTKEAIIWAPAALVEGDKVSFYACSFISVQDTLFDALGRHYFENCYIEGAIDFIFGNAQSYYERCNLYVDTSLLGPGHSNGYITAQGRETSKETTGYVFRANTIKGSGPTLLGRAYRSHSRVLFYRTYMSDIVLPQGWDAWNYTGHEKTITFAEDLCFGPGANKSQRVHWEKKLSRAERKCKKGSKNNPFIMAAQAKQVLYILDLVNDNWSIVLSFPKWKFSKKEDYDENYDLYHDCFIVGQSIHEQVENIQDNDNDSDTNDRDYLRNNIKE
ncbi:probable pectinesterase 55 [Humulus lupulus]|uniref:probable pectinesterase 55 n=1 Tax=Humulus lupulus TaxID=3486 RepID=UPI002B408325|nr:probable pectinesterase 55 [Humulus lupulus]